MDKKAVIGTFSVASSWGRCGGGVGMIFFYNRWVG